MKKIQSSVLDSVIKLINSMSHALSDVIDSLGKSGIKTDGGEKTEDGGVILKATTGGGNKVQITVNPTGKKDIFNISIEGMSGKGKGKHREYTNIPAKKIEDKVGSFVDDVYGETLEDMEETKSSKRLDVTLQKVQGSKGSYIQLQKVYANYDSVEAYQALVDALSNDEVANMISEAPASFIIVDDGDSIDVNPAETVEVDVTTTYIEPLRAALQLFYTIKDVHWNADGENFFDFHTKLDEYNEKILEDIDTLGEFCAQFATFVPNLATLSSTADDSSTIPDPRISTFHVFNRQEAYSVIREFINRYLTVLNLYYCNMPHDVQSDLDNIIRYWDKEANYKLSRQQDTAAE